MSKNLLQAHKVLREYIEPHSTVDNGNLYFAATEYKKAYSELQAQCDKLAEQALQLTKTNESLKSS